jgi:hypothetical protein
MSRERGGAMDGWLYFMMVHAGLWVIAFEIGYTCSWRSLGFGVDL